MAESFPASPPGRPPKLDFGKRLSHKFKSQTKTCEQSKSASSVTSDDHYPPVASPVPCAQDDHVRTRRITPQSASRVLLKARPETLKSEPVQPRGGYSIISLAFPEPHIVYPTAARTSSHTSRLAEEQYGVPTLHRKRPPQLTVRAALVERFEKLRLPATTHTPLASAAVTASRSTTNFSFPLQFSNSTKAAELAWNRMVVSNPILPSVFRERPHSPTIRPDASHHGQGENSTDPIVIDDGSDHGVTVGLSRLTSNFEISNSFQSGGLSRQLLNRRRTRPDRLHQSPNESNINSEGNLTPDSLETTESDLSAYALDSLEAALRTRDVNLNRNAHQAQDRLLAQHLQDNMYLKTSSQLTEISRSSATQAISPEAGPLDSLRQAITHIGTREAPIDLNLDVDVPATAVPERTRIQDYVALHGEPMHIDGMSPFDAPQTTNVDVDESTHLRRRDCVVCGGSTPVNGLPSLANCNHRPETCADCYSKWITAQLQGSSWRGAKCPGNNCNINLSYHEIRIYADSKTFRQYDKFMARETFTRDPDFRWCRACNSGQIHIGGVEGNIFTCAGCGSKACVIHENTWHEGETCEEFEYRSAGRRRQEKASLKVIGELTKKCPGPRCDWNIEKNEGCDHITCTKCGYEFCWVCLCNFNHVRRVGNSAHATTCNYHSSRIS